MIGVAHNIGNAKEMNVIYHLETTIRLYMSFNVQIFLGVSNRPVKSLE